MVSRHDLVWLTEAGWHAAIAQAGMPELAQWQAQGWPATGTRRAPDLDAQAVSLGIALPPAPDGTKRRIGFTVAHGHVQCSAPPMLLDDLIGHAPVPWRAPLAALTAQLRLRAYGSLALQGLTGQAYLRPGSDIDLLFAPDSGAELAHGLSLLAASPLPLDGEIKFPNGACVAWREWPGAQVGAARVLAKFDDGVRLMRVDHLTATLR